MHWWWIALGANAVIAIAYVAIAYRIVSNLVHGQWRRNPLAVATAGIFFTCAVHHGAHLAHLTGLFGVSRREVDGARTVFGHWHVAVWDVVGAAVAVWYWSLRSRFTHLTRSTAVFEDLRERQRHAFEINDEVVQCLVAAKLHFELGRPQAAMTEVDHALHASQDLVTELVASGPLRPGSLRRRAASERPRR